MDAELLRRVQADDLDAFEEFFARYRASIYRTAYGLTGDRQAAEEILQDTFARAYQRRHTLHTDVSPLPWLHRVSLNLCYSRLARRRVVTNPIDDATESSRADDGPLPADQAEQAELRRIVRDGIAALPEKHRSVVVLYYLQRLSLQETAEGRDRQHRGLDRLGAAVAPVEVSERGRGRRPDLATIDEVDEQGAMTAAGAGEVDHEALASTSSGAAW